MRIDMCCLHMFNLINIIIENDLKPSGMRCLHMPHNKCPYAQRRDKNNKIKKNKKNEKISSVDRNKKINRANDERVPLTIGSWNNKTGWGASTSNFLLLLLPQIF